jgi:hypothetical protein
MALQWDVSKIDEKIRLVGDGNNVRMSPTTNVMIWATMSVEMGRITEENVDEFAFRLDMWQAATSSLLHKRDLTREDVVNHIGLVTNVITLSRAQFEAKVKRALWNELRDKMYYRSQARGSEAVK